MPDTHSLPPVTSRSDALTALRQEMQQQGIDMFLLPRFDAHQGEYVADHDARLAFVTGFTGSAGMAIITADQAALFIDGRYQVQALGESPAPLFSHHHLFDTPPESWLDSYLERDQVVALDAMHWPPSWADRFQGICDAKGAILRPLTQNPVDAIWADQPPKPAGRITPFPLQFAGASTDDKAADLARALADCGAAWHVETQPDNIAWFLNLRGADTEFVPAPNSFLLCGVDGQIHWFVDTAKFEDGLRDHLPARVAIAPEADFLPALEQVVGRGDKARIDPDFSPMAARLALTKAGATPVAAPSLLTQRKARKNPTELEGLRACHIEDGIAWTEFSAWIAHEVPARAAAGDPLTERELEQKIFALRGQRAGFLGNSFNPISAAGSNGAMCHYATTDQRNAPVLPDAPYLLDSGGQYETGTTDATRSFTFGDTRPDGYDRAYTAVFKAFHALATLRFPPGTQGHHIDAIARRPLWDLGLDYDHGTGHGIGHRLSVHEHPQRIGKPVNQVDLLPGMVITIEPGHYVAGRYGIRIENVFAIVEDPDGFMRFENLTWAPIQTDMLIPGMLSDAETNWLSAYHAELATLLAPYLSDAARDWLQSR